MGTSIHIIIVLSGELKRETLLSEWLKRTPTAEVQGQDIRQANDEAVRELFKYFHKASVSTQKSKRDTAGKITQTREIHLSALDIIFTACKGRRTIPGIWYKAAQESKS